MKAATKVFVFVLVLLALAAAGLFLLLRETTDLPQPVVFSDGTTVRLVAVTYGTNHVWGTTRLARAVSRLPGPVRGFLERSFSRTLGLTARQTSEPGLMVWIEHWGPMGGGRSSRKAFLRPIGGPVAGYPDHLSLWNQPTNAVSLVPIRFPVFPRSPENIELVLFEENRGTDSWEFDEMGSFRFPNPARSGPVATNWIAPPLPAEAHAGDLRVTLLSFVSGVGNQTSSHYRNGRTEVTHAAAKPGHEPGSMVRVAFDSPRGTNETWIMFNADLADSAGNSLGAQSRSSKTTNMTFRPVLWDEGDPWRLRLHLKRTAGFTGNELGVFSNVPLPAVGSSNRLDLTNSAGGIEVVLRHFVRRAELTNDSWNSSQTSVIRIEHRGLGETNQLDLIDITARPAGTDLSHDGSSWTDSYHEYQFRSFPAGTTHLDLTLAVQPTRHVEFLVDPNWTTNDLVFSGPD